MIASFSSSPLVWTLLTLGQILLVTVVLLLSCAFLIWGDRKLFAGVQMRKGPNVVGPFGLLQSFADLGKFILKEMVIPAGADKPVFLLAPLISVTLALAAWAAMPLGPGWVVSNINVGILYLFALSSMGVYGIIMGGWASNSKYPFLGSVRASAQLISYELSLTISVLPVFLLINRPGMPATLSLVEVVQQQSGVFPSWHGLWLVFVMPVSALIFLVALFAETNRLPFDMIESEADLVGGFHTEYGSFKWSLFFVAEYSHMTVGSGVFVLLFFGGWNPLPWVPLASVVHWLGLQGWPVVVGAISIAIFLAKVLFMIFFFMWVRWTVPRFRYDHVMRIGWRGLLPLSLLNLIAYALAIALLQKPG
jgi:NADH-quinone oxidoreductase subunit H